MDTANSDAEISYRPLTSGTGTTQIMGASGTGTGGNKKKNKFPRFRSKHEARAIANSSRLNSKESEKPMILLQESDSDDSDREGVYSDEFGGIRPLIDEQSIVTGRMRKKLVARSKGGEFRSHRQKRRLYTCCISSLIKLQELYTHLARDIFSSKSIWEVSILGEVLILSKCRDVIRSHDYETIDDISIPLSGSVNIIHPDNQVVFIFEFGAIVFWGFSNGQEKYLLNVFRRFTDQDQLYHGATFQKGEDDMAFVSSTKRSDVSISNDVIVLPAITFPPPLPLPHTSPSHSRSQSLVPPPATITTTPTVTYELLLSVSYAIAQSTVVSIFEHRIEMKISEYKFIPETLARGEPVNLTTDKLGMMIGDIFQIKHDLNLHTDILDIPDTLWAANDEYLTLYDRMFRYLEVQSRVEVMNKRIDMQKEILDMLQHHFHRDHIANLDTIIIWLLAVEVIVQVFGGGGMLLGFWGNRAGV